MKKQLRSKSFRVMLLVGFAIFAAVLIMDLTRGNSIVRSLCDGFFVAGMLVMGMSGLMFAGNEGVFDIFGFGISHLFTTRWPGLSTMPDDHRKEKYVDYKARKRKNPSKPLPVLLAGAIYMVLAVLMLAVYLIVE